MCVRERGTVASHAISRVPAAASIESENGKREALIECSLELARPLSLPLNLFLNKQKKRGEKKLQASSPSNRSRKRQPSRATQESSAPCASQRSWTRATKFLRPRPPLLHSRRPSFPSRARRVPSLFSRRTRVHRRGRRKNRALAASKESSQKKLFLTPPTPPSRPSPAAASGSLATARRALVDSVQIPAHVGCVLKKPDSVSNLFRINAR